jgi:hypothetical protein
MLGCKCFAHDMYVSRLLTLLPRGSPSRSRSLSQPRPSKRSFFHPCKLAKKSRKNKATRRSKGGERPARQTRYQYCTATSQEEKRGERDDRPRSPKGMPLSGVPLLEGKKDTPKKKEERTMRQLKYQARKLHEMQRCVWG